MFISAYRDLLRKASFLGSLGSLSLAPLVATLVLASQMATYGVPVKLLVLFGLAAAVLLGFRYAIRRRSGTIMNWEYSW